MALGFQHCVWRGAIYGLSNKVLEERNLKRVLEHFGGVLQIGNENSCPPSCLPMRLPRKEAWFAPACMPPCVRPLAAVIWGHAGEGSLCFMLKMSHFFTSVLFSRERKSFTP